MSDDEHDWVRRMLADAGRSPEPTPDWVSARIEETLDELHAERASTPAEVVEMTPRRHRRWGAALLAAAAVAVGGYSIGATGVIGSVSGGSSEESSATDAGAESGASAAPEAGSPETGDVVALSSATLRADARTLARDLPAALLAPDAVDALPGSQQGEVTQDDAGGAWAEESTEPDRTGGDPLVESSTRGAVGAGVGSCDAVPVSLRGSRRAVTLDGEPATAVVRRVEGGRARVEVWSCNGSRRLAQVTVRP